MPPAGCAPTSAWPPIQIVGSAKPPAALNSASSASMRSSVVGSATHARYASSESPTRCASFSQPSRVRLLHRGREERAGHRVSPARAARRSRPRARRRARAGACAAAPAGARRAGGSRAPRAAARARRCVIRQKGHSKSTKSTTVTWPAGVRAISSRMAVRTRDREPPADRRWERRTRGDDAARARDRRAREAPRRPRRRTQPPPGDDSALAMPLASATQQKGQKCPSAHCATSSTAPASPASVARPSCAMRARGPASSDATPRARNPSEAHDGQRHPERHGEGRVLQGVAPAALRAEDRRRSRVVDDERRARDQPGQDGSERRRPAQARRLRSFAFPAMTSREPIPRGHRSNLPAGRATVIAADGHAPADPRRDPRSLGSETRPLHAREIASRLGLGGRLPRAPAPARQPEPRGGADGAAGPALPPERRPTAGRRSRQVPRTASARACSRCTRAASASWRASTPARGDDVFVPPEAHGRRDARRQGARPRAGAQRARRRGRGRRDPRARHQARGRHAAPQGQERLARAGRHARARPHRPAARHRRRGLRRATAATTATRSSSRITRWPESPDENPEGRIESVLGRPGELSVEVGEDPRPRAASTRRTPSRPSPRPRPSATRSPEAHEGGARGPAPPPAADHRPGGRARPRRRGLGRARPSAAATARGSPSPT